MDQYKSQLEGAGMCVQLTACLCACAKLAAFITFWVYLGIFAFNNPDNQAWYGVTAGVEGLSADQPAATATDVVDIHGRFVNWFLWGFINLVVCCGGGLFAGIFSASVPVLGQCCGFLASCSGCSGLAWWITGMVWRLNAAGSFASGDAIPAGTTEEDWKTAISAEDSLFQYSSGNFMYTYLLITWILMGVSCGCAILGALVSCICK